MEFVADSLTAIQGILNAYIGMTYPDPPLYALAVIPYISG